MADYEAPLVDHDALMTPQTRQRKQTDWAERQGDLLGKVLDDEDDIDVDGFLQTQQTGGASAWAEKLDGDVAEEEYLGIDTEKEELQRKLQEAEEAVKQANAEKLALQEAHDELVAQAIKAKETLDKVIAQKQAAEAESEKLKSSLAAATEAAEKHKSEADNSKKALEKAEAEAKQLAASGSASAAAISEKEAEIKKLQAAHAEAVKEQQKLEADAKEAEKKLELQKSELEKIAEQEKQTREQGEKHVGEMRKRFGSVLVPGNKGLGEDDIIIVPRTANQRMCHTDQFGRQHCTVPECSVM